MTLSGSSSSEGGKGGRKMGGNALDCGEALRKAWQGQWGILIPKSSLRRVPCLQVRACLSVPDVLTTARMNAIAADQVLGHLRVLSERPKRCVLLAAPPPRRLHPPHALGCLGVALYLSH